MIVSLIEDAAALAALCERIAAVDRIALDTEFHNEKSYAARLMVVQVVIGDEVALVDPLGVRDLAPLAAALGTKTIVGHALQSDLKIFADRFDRLPAAAFDTQLAAAFCGYGMSISLADLVHDIVGIRLRKSQTVSDWSVRPLSPQQIEYLVDDVVHLFNLQDRLTERLQAAGRYAWFEADARPLVDLARYRPDPERLYLRVPGAMRMNRRELGILREIALLRDTLARERDVPLKYIIPDDVMAAIVALRPATRDDLAQLRRLDAGARKAFGERIVVAVAAGIALPDADLPHKPARPPGSERESIVAALAVLASAIASDNDLPTGLLVTRGALERVARELPASPAELACVLDASDWRAALVAEPALCATLGPRGAYDRRRGARRATRRARSASVSRDRGRPAAVAKSWPVMQQHPDSFRARGTLAVGERTYEMFRLDALEKAGFNGVSRLPFSLKILLENLIRFEDGRSVTKDDVSALAAWSPNSAAKEIAYRPARVLLQDFTGVPCVVDLAAMRDAMAEMGGDPKKINPLQPVELVIDHSVQVDRFGTSSAFAENAKLEFERNGERYAFLKWGQHALDNFRAVPPDTGIVHQVNIEFLGRVVFGAGGAGVVAADDRGGVAYPDTVVGTDSHTTMANGLGILAWGVGGIEAEAAMLGQPVTMLLPDVIGVRIIGKMNEGVTSTDLVLTITQMLRAKGVVGKFVEFFGAGLSHLSVADRVTIGNMSPEYGSTVAIFPIDHQTLSYLRLTGRGAEQIALVEAYARSQGLYRTDDSPDPVFSEVLELDLGTVVPNLAGPRRPQDRVALSDVKAEFNAALGGWQSARDGANPKSNDYADARFADEGGGTAVATRPETKVSDGAVVIAAITSCTNTSNPAVMIGAGLVAKKAVERGLTRKPWVKTSLAPGSKVVTDYLAKSGLQPYLDELGFNLVGYGCTTCIGNSGPLPDDVAHDVAEHDMIVAAVLSGNRNFEGRIHPQVRANYLASPPLVVAYALAGRMDVDLTTEPLGRDAQGRDVMLADLWPTSAEIDAAVVASVSEAAFRARYADVFAGDENWRAMEVPTSERYAWDPQSEYVKKPPYFEGMPVEPRAPGDIRNSRVLALLGDSVTTDHISPAGSIARTSPAAAYLIARGVDPSDFNSYGARRGNHEVMVRGTFANVRLRNALVPGIEGGVTRYLPDDSQTSIFDAAMRYKDNAIPVIVIGGKEYGSGSSRDWAAKGPMLLGVRAVIAESFERIHRSNLIGMGILPLEFLPGETRASLGLSGEETYDILGLGERIAPGNRLHVIVRDGSDERRFETLVRIDTPDEAEYFRHGGILQYVLRQLRAGA